MSDNRWIRLLGEIARAVLKAFLSDGDRGTSSGEASSRTTPSGTPVPKPGPPATGGRGAPGPSSGNGSYPGDFLGTIRPTYSPDLDGEPDPGEVVWTWVPYEEDHSQGKDRPVLLVGRDGKWLLGLQLTSKDHVRHGEQGGRGGRRWMDIGTGGWDRQGRPSEVRLNRVIRIDPDAVRREGDVLDRAVFDKVVAAL
ncbi:type II toxin-antitoxin system PemK/MazF family toxin [Myceligenerans xiligouense]|uniref:PemK-like, MazF-like toxin of type II toxin-antitoxin system n=1 Tax=Myceligenerans xiligouense TaxID=253184 RepID=A0A3N4YMB9_9MICO|nr:type II toxin-antitoxin system PemK/MazF family toxin [Myceligenerans xiligouense]RPF20586.1 PemK-like, MazF-like toxin of type II toxin-antitoxin system [Myceligenerans xiligouense]